MDLSILIVTFNSAGQIGECLRSLSAEARALATEIVVIDNASSDGTAAVVRAQFPDVRVIELPRNLGFAAGINRGLRATTGRSVLWLNPDGHLVAGRVADVLAWLDTRPDVGIVGGRVLDPSGAVQLSARAFPSYGAVLGARYSILTRLFPGNRFSRHFLRTDSSYSAIEPVDWVSGAFLLHTRALADRLGGLDEGFFMYFEDVNFCYRAWRAGSKVYYHPGMTIQHEIGGSSEGVPMRMLVARHRSLWRWYTKHFRRFWLKDAVVWLGVWTRCGVLMASRLVGRRPA